MIRYARHSHKKIRRFEQIETAVYRFAPPKAEQSKRQLFTACFLILLNSPFS